MTPLLAILAMITAASTSVVLSAWWLVASLLHPALQLLPPVNVRQSLPPPGQQWGGGSDTDAALHSRVIAIADALRRIGQVVNQPGQKAIKAVLLIRAGTPVSEALKIAGTTKPSIGKYRPLVDQVIGACAATAALASTAALVGPVAVGVACGTLAATVLAPSIKALPNVSNVHLLSETNDGIRLYRIWHATIRTPDGTARECQTEPVRHEPPTPDETDDARRKREHAEHERIVRALRALDAEAIAAHRACDRLRKRVKAAQRLSVLPALPIPEGDPSWALPVGERPHFIGEHVWLPDPINSALPQLASIRRLYRDGSAEVATDQDGTLSRAPAAQLVSLGAPVPTFIGQRVEMRSGRGDISEDAVISAVHGDGTVNVQLFNASTGTYDGPERHHLVMIVKPDTSTRLVEILADEDHGDGKRWNSKHHCWEPEHLHRDGTPPYGYSKIGWSAGRSRVALLVFNSTTLRYDYFHARVIKETTMSAQRVDEATEVNAAGDTRRSGENQGQRRTLAAQA